MKTEDILTIEESAENRINLVRDRLFWQAWNRSAFLFVSHIKKYQVHKRFVQKVSQEVAWLGFPKTALAEIEKIARGKQWSFEEKSGDHIIIGGVPTTNGYEKWWAGIIKPARFAPDADPVKKVSAGSKKQPQLLSAYKIAYDLCLHIHRATAKMAKEYRYELGARVRGYATDITENLHLMCNVKPNMRVSDPKAGPIVDCANTIHRLRIDIRILNDLQQISVKQWGFLNLQIEKLLDSLRAEFCKINIGFAGATLNQSSGTLPPAVNAGEHAKSGENFLL
jgi:hypothetical protein